MNHAEGFLSQETSSSAARRQAALRDLLHEASINLPEHVRKTVLDCCLHDNGFKFDLKVAVVMPDHVHLIFTPLVNQETLEIFSLADIMDAIKGTSSHKVNKVLLRRGRLWQTESFDHVPRSSENLDAKVAYVLDNPVRAGLARYWSEYPWLWRKASVNPFGP